MGEGTIAMGKDARFREQILGQSGNGAATGGAGPVILDSLGRMLREGDAVTLSTRTPVVFRIMKIAPVFDPTAPVGTIQLHCVCMATYTPKNGQMLGEVMRVGEAAEMGPSPLQFAEGSAAAASGGAEGEQEVRETESSGPRLVES